MRVAMFLAVFALAAPLFAQQPVEEEGSATFRTVDIYVDSKGTPLAAYQIKISFTNANVKIVGIEGGEHPAFREPPMYDPKALQHERAIIAAFNTSSEGQLPKSKTRVATIHVQASIEGGLQCVLKAQAAANPEGKRIVVEATWEERKDK